jgi:hypothetical protein
VFRPGERVREALEAVILVALAGTLKLLLVPLRARAWMWRWAALAGMVLAQPAGPVVITEVVTAARVRVLRVVAEAAHQMFVKAVRLWLIESLLLAALAVTQPELTAAVVVVSTALMLQLTVVSVGAVVAARRPAEPLIVALVAAAVVKRGRWVKAAPELPVVV